MKRLNKFIAENSQFSRRKADELIANGKVKINNKTTSELGIQIDPQKDKVTVNSQEINPQAIPQIYLALNKPAGYITTRQDEKNRETVMELLPKIPNLKPVGRLDKDTEGLLLISNDGEFINQHTHPKFECEKEYFAKIQGTLTPSEINELENGIIVEGKKTAPAKVKILKSKQNQTTLRITIHEGRNRQIRKMFAYFNAPVKYLQRVRIGKIKLGSLKKGSYRKLNEHEING